MARGFIERLLPVRLGRDFRWLVASSWMSNLGDGFSVAAGPLLVASETRDPSLVALATLLQRLPWVLFSVPAGVLADRMNRVATVVAVDLLRGALLGLFALDILSGHVTIEIVLAVMFLLGTAEVFSNTASGTILPSLVERDDLTLANSRLQAGFVTVYQLLGPPLGAGLFAIGVFVPFAGQALFVAAGALLIARVRPPARPQRTTGWKTATEDIAQGFAWAFRHPAVRTLVVTIFTFNITFGAAWAVLVLYAEERLRMGPVGFGLLTAAAAVGGIAGTVSYGWITARISLSNIMRIGLIIETFTHLSLALTRSPVIALVIMVVFGAHAFIWGTTSITIRQRAVPDALRGRVSAVNSLGVFSGLLVGAAISGPIASAWGITAPFWFAFAGSALFVLLIWRQLRYLAHDAPSLPA